MWMLWCGLAVARPFPTETLPSGMASMEPAYVGDLPDAAGGSCAVYHAHVDTPSVGGQMSRNRWAVVLCRDGAGGPVAIGSVALRGEETWNTRLGGGRHGALEAAVLRSGRLVAAGVTWRLVDRALTTEAAQVSDRVTLGWNGYGETLVLTNRGDTPVDVGGWVVRGTGYANAGWSADWQASAPQYIALRPDPETGTRLLSPGASVEVAQPLTLYEDHPHPLVQATLWAGVTRVARTATVPNVSGMLRYYAPTRLGVLFDEAGFGCSAEYIAATDEEPMGWVVVPCIDPKAGWDLGAILGDVGVPAGASAPTVVDGALHVAGIVWRVRGGRLVADAASLLSPLRLEWAADGVVALVNDGTVPIDAVGLVIEHPGRPSGWGGGQPPEPHFTVVRGVDGGPRWIPPDGRVEVTLEVSADRRNRPQWDQGPTSLWAGAQRVSVLARPE